MTTSVKYDQWVRQLTAIKKEFPAEQMDKLVRYFTLQAFRGVTLGSPVGNPDLWRARRKDGTPIAPAGYVGGHFRSNWQIAVGTVNYAVKDETDGNTNPDGVAQAALAASSALKTNPYQIVYIINPLPYAVRLEEGWSTQAPGPAAIAGKTASALAAAAPGIFA